MVLVGKHSCSPKIVLAIVRNGSGPILCNPAKTEFHQDHWEIGGPEVSGRWVATPLFLCLLVIERLGEIYGVVEVVWLKTYRWLNVDHGGSIGLCWEFVFLWSIVIYIIYIYYLRHFPSEQVFVFVLRFSDIVFATDSVPAVLGTTQDNKGVAGMHNNFFESPQSAAVQRLSLQTFKLQKQNFLFRCFLESLDALEQWYCDKGVLDPAHSLQDPFIAYSSCLDSKKCDRGC